MGTPEFSIALPDTSANGGETVHAQASYDIDKTDYYTKDNGQVMIPFRAMVEGLGYKLTWDEKNKRAEIVKGAAFTAVELGKDEYFFAKVAPFSLGAAPELHNKNMYVPAEFVSKVLHGDIEQTDAGAIQVTLK
jgi:hypothetical protein